MSSSVQLLVFDSRRGNEEGQESEKLLGFYPPNTPNDDQISIAGLIQGLLTFSSAFAPTGDDPRQSAKQHHEIIENEASIWVVFQSEPDIYLTLLASKTWLPRHVPQDNLLAALVHASHLMGLLFCSIQTLLNQDASGALARSSISHVLSHVGYELTTPGSWMHREIRSPFTSLGRARAASLSLGTTLDVHSLCHRIQALPRMYYDSSNDYDEVDTKSPTLKSRLDTGSSNSSSSKNHGVVEDVAIFYKQMLLWSTLLPANSSRLSSLVCSSIFAPILQGAPPSSPPPLSPPTSISLVSPLFGSGSKAAPKNVSPSTSTISEGKNLRVIDGGFAVILNSNTKTSSSPSSSSSSPGQTPPRQNGKIYELPFVYDTNCKLRPLLIYNRGDIIILTFLAREHRHVHESIMNAVRREVDIPSQQLAHKLAEESQEQGGELGHIPSWRYALHDAGSIRASPRSKVSAMSHHARAVGTAVMDSLSRMYPSSMVLPLPVPWKVGIDSKGKGEDEGDSEDDSDAGDLVVEDALGNDVDICVRSCQGTWTLARGTPQRGQMSLVVREKKVDGGGYAQAMQNIEQSLQTLSLV